MRLDTAEVPRRPMVGTLLAGEEPACGDVDSVIVEIRGPGAGDERLDELRLEREGAANAGGFGTEQGQGRGVADRLGVDEVRGQIGFGPLPETEFVVVGIAIADRRSQVKKAPAPRWPRRTKAGRSLVRWRTSRLHHLCQRRSGC